MFTVGWCKRHLYFHHMYPIAHGSRLTNRRPGCVAAATLAPGACLIYTPFVSQKKHAIRNSVPEQNRHAGGSRSTSTMQYALDAVKMS